MHWKSLKKKPNTLDNSFKSGGSSYLASSCLDLTDRPPIASANCFCAKEIRCGAVGELKHSELSDKEMLREYKEAQIHGEKVKHAYSMAEKGGRRV